MGEDKSKKRKRTAAPAQPSTSTSDADIDTSKPTAIYTPRAPRPHTLSLALPGSIISNAQTHDLRTALAGTIARACAVFSIDEIVIFNDGTATPRRSAHQGRDFESESNYTGVSDPGGFLQHLLEYLECPPHLRTRLFALHPNLRTAGALPSCDMPHHLRGEEWCAWREGVTVPPPAGEAGGKKKKRKGADATDAPGPSYVDVGLGALVAVPDAIPPHTRVTVKLPASPPAGFPGALEQMEGKAVDPATPREQEGYYWGYAVRRAASLAKVFTECAFEGGYDVSIGTSERGVPVETVLPGGPGAVRKVPKTFKHAVIVVGGVAGLEVAVEADEELKEMGIGKGNVGSLFDYWVDVCPGQGSRTIRAEEAVWITLAQLRTWAHGGVGV
ncbi:DUF171-domain-containing protein [Trichodelitschia bisporula]|uniref:DUF171-domain-containing protein n=1 Tax=Trichodelitschia bisporula TaxID=703511 RepID=A0A6G1HWJ1_9PEZI|nr:DUF171-domain-containing protein [Trichodelitschia bisporula]